MSKGWKCCYCGENIDINECFKHEMEDMNAFACSQECLDNWIKFYNTSYKEMSLENYKELVK